ncbi:cytochrome P450 [Sparassis latifolia]
MLHTIDSFLLLVPVVIVLYFLYTLLRLLVRQASSPLRYLPGPPAQSFFVGNLRELHDQENNNIILRWEAQYGSTFIYHGFLGGCRLMTTDPVAVAYVMNRAYEYPKPDWVRAALAGMASGDDGLLTVDGEVHRKQRKILNPAFSSSHVRLLNPVFWDTAVRLRDIWLDIISLQPQSNRLPDVSNSSADLPTSTKTSTVSSNHVTASTTSFLLPQCSANSEATQRTHSQSRSPRINDPVSPILPASPTVDVLPWFGRATLDIIGKGGFGYDIDSLSTAAQCNAGEPNENELAHAFSIIFSSATKLSVFAVLHAWFPVLRNFRSNNSTMKQAHATMRRIGLSLIEERRASITADPVSQLVGGTDDLDDDMPLSGQDLLSILIRSNLSSVSSQRLSLEEILCQISTFLSAGHETTAAALTWTLYALARASDIQATLRNHLCTVPTLLSGDSCTPPSSALFDAINRLPYLDYVVRESLRLHSPVVSTMRVATSDDVIPLERPLRDRRGHVCTEVRVKRGDLVSIPLQAPNKSKRVWGEDAEVFRPERWEEMREEMKQDTLDGRKSIQPGLWGNMLTFGHGPRACIGYRFALSEIKVFLYVLLRDLEFSIDSSIEIEKKVNVVARPCVKSQPDNGNQMPLRIRRVHPFPC